MSNRTLVQPFEFMAELPDSREACFVLGTEYEALYQRALHERAEWSAYVHANNAERVMTMLQRQGRRMIRHEPWGDGWVRVTVAAAPDSSEAPKP